LEIAGQGSASILFFETVLIGIARQFKKIQLSNLSFGNNCQRPGALGKVNPKVLPLPT
jgi:hypothetical protein